MSDAITMPPVDTMNATWLPWLTVGAFNSTRGVKRPPMAKGALHVKGVTPELHRRLRVAAAEEGLAYHALLDLLLDQRDARIRRQRVQQASPLHRPPPEHLDDVAVSM